MVIAMRPSDEGARPIECEDKYYAKPKVCDLVHATRVWSIITLTSRA
jgi:hypothetical protein